MNRLGFTEKEVGRMTYGKFSRLYQAYKDNFDLEMQLTTNKVKYADLNNNASFDEAIPM